MKADNGMKALVHRDGSSRLRSAVARGKTLVCYLTASDPNDEGFLEAAIGAVEGGAGVLEIGIPHSDPVADGPVIQRAHERALASGGGTKRTLELVEVLRRELTVPIVLFTYANPVWAVGVERFAIEASAAGADGVLTLDVPPEEEPGWVEHLVAHGLDPVVLMSPNTSEHRGKNIAAVGCGFIYVIAREGITGTHDATMSEVGRRVARAREESDGLPVVVGFGIRTHRDVQRVWELAEGAVVGSALIERLADEPISQRRAVARRFVEDLRMGSSVDKRSEETES